MSVTAVLLAAGSGERAGGRAKQFLDLAGRPMVAHSLEAMEACPDIEAVVLVVPSSSDMHYSTPKVCSNAAGGPTRQASLSEGIVCLPDETSMVLVHDAARPLTTPELFTRVIKAVDESVQGAVSAMPLEDALKEVSESGEVIAHRSRIGMWRAQTPQAFEREALEDSLARADATGLVADDCSQMLLAAGYKVRVVPGEPWNLKVTTLDDFRLCESILKARA